MRGGDRFEVIEGRCYFSLGLSGPSSLESKDRTFGFWRGGRVWLSRVGGGVWC